MLYVSFATVFSQHKTTETSGTADRYRHDRHEEAFSGSREKSERTSSAPHHPAMKLRHHEGRPLDKLVQKNQNWQHPDSGRSFRNDVDLERVGHDHKKQEANNSTKQFLERASHIRVKVAESSINIHSSNGDLIRQHLMQDKSELHEDNSRPEESKDRIIKTYQTADSVTKRYRAVQFLKDQYELNTSIKAHLLEPFIEEHNEKINSNKEETIPENSVKQDSRKKQSIARVENFRSNLNTTQYHNIEKSKQDHREIEHSDKSLGHLKPKANEEEMSNSDDSQIEQQKHEKNSNPEHSMKEIPNKEQFQLTKNSLEKLETGNPTQKHFPPRNRHARLWNFSKATSEVRHIVFAKVHKAASSTVQNILLRFALDRDLNVLLPARPPIFTDQSSHITGILPHPDGEGKLFDIHCTHVIFNEREISRYFPASSVRFAILREPIGQAVSALAYYSRNYPTLGLVQGFYKHPRDPINGFLNNPSDFYDSKQRSAPVISFINNRMSVDLGFHWNRFEEAKHNLSKINIFLEKVEQQFDLVLISDYFDESMVLLRRYLSWPMKDILYIKRNAAHFDPNSVWNRRPVLNSTTYETFRQWNRIDFQLYEHFLTIFLHKIKEEKYFKEELKAYKWILKNVKEFCEKKSKTNTLKVSKGRWNEDVTVSATDCQLMLKTEPEFIIHAGKVQMKRYLQNNHITQQEIPQIFSAYKRFL